MHGAQRQCFGGIFSAPFQASGLDNLRHDIASLVCRVRVGIRLEDAPRAPQSIRSAPPVNALKACVPVDWEHRAGTRRNGRTVSGESNLVNQRRRTNKLGEMNPDGGCDGERLASSTRNGMFPPPSRCNIPPPPSPPVPRVCSVWSCRAALQRCELLSTDSSRHSMERKEVFRSRRAAGGIPRRTLHQN